MRTRTRRGRWLLPAGVVLAASMLCGGTARATGGPYERGPEPTQAGITAAQGPFAIAKQTVPMFRGGGGTLETAAAQPGLKAAIGLAPWDINLSTSKIQVPTMIMGATGDKVAPVGGLAEPFYTAITNAPKALLELNGGTHFSFTTPNDTIAEYSIAWLKRFVDDDTRYDQFLCPTPSTSDAIAVFRDTCPL